MMGDDLGNICMEVILKNNNLGPVVVAQAMGEPETLPRVSLFYISGLLHL
jgi:hypothetical protein